MKRVLLTLMTLLLTTLCGMTQEVVSITIDPAETTVATTLTLPVEATISTSERVIGWVEEWWSKPNRDCKFEVRIGQPDIYVYSYVDDIDGYHKSGLWGKYLNSKYKAGPKHYTILPTIGFYGHLSRHLEVGASMIYHSFRQNSYDVTTGMVDECLNQSSFFISPEVRWNLFYFRYMRAYVGLGLDFGASNNPRGASSEFALSVNYGVTYGARIFWFLDAHMGGCFESYNVGIGYRF